MSTSTSPTAQQPSRAIESGSKRACLFTRFEGVVQVSAAIIVSATVTSGLMFWTTRPIKERRVARPAVATETHSSSNTVSYVRAADPDRGKTVFSQTCFACHGPTGAGIPGVGAPLRTSKFVASHSDDQLLSFIKVGRQPFDAETVLHLTMPPKGGNPALSDTALRDVIAFIRTLQNEESQTAGKPIAVISQ